MGNCGCLSSAAVSSLTEDELGQTAKDDGICLGLFQRLLPNNEIGVMASGLDKYKLRSAATEIKALPDPEEAELALLCVQSDVLTAEKQRSELISSLSNRIQSLQESEKSPDAGLVKTQTQILCRVYDALLREEEREKRKVIKKVEGEVKLNKEGKGIPPVARIGLDFGINVLLSLVEVVGLQNPLIVKKVLDVAARVIGKLEPFSLVEYDSSITESIEAITTLFGSILSGQIPGLDRSDELKTMTAMMGLALASGSLGSCLSLAQKFLSFPADPAWSVVLKASIPMMNKLYSLSGSSKKTTWTWNTQKVGPDIMITNGDKTITRTNSAAWGNNLTEQTMTSGIHYVELKIDANSSSCLLIGVAGLDFANWGDKCSINNVICYQADGDIYVNGSGAGKAESYTAGDRMGMLIDADGHRVSFYKNGAAVGKESYEGVPAESAVIICFGGSDQFVTLTDDPDIPEGIDSGNFAEKKDEAEAAKSTLFPQLSSDILTNAAFNSFTKLETTGTESALLTATFLLVSLDSQGDKIFRKFELDQVKASYCSKVTFQRTVGLSLDVQETTFGFLLEILSFLLGAFTKKNWEEVDFRLATWSSLSCLRILRNHIFAGKLLELPETETGLTPNTLATMRTTLEFFSKVTLEGLSLKATPENEIAVEALSSTAAMVIIHSFELYYPTLNSQLEFLLDGLSESGSRVGENRLMSEVMKRIRLPVNLILAFDTSSDETRARVQRFLQVLLSLSSQQALTYIAGEQDIDEGLVVTFFMAHNILMARIMKIGMSEEGLSLFRPFAFQFLGVVEQLLEKVVSISGGEISNALESRIKNTILGRQTVTFLKALSLFQFDSEFNSKLTVTLLRLSKFLGQLHGGKPGHAKGVFFENIVFESEHPYADNLDVAYKFEVPRAVGYQLSFDPRCNSEQNCDYLELWTEAEKVNRLYRWEGTTWPTEPITVNQSGLYFTFHSDGSRAEWGWKIDIAAMITSEILTETWVNELRTCTSSLLVSLAKSLIVTAGAAGDAAASTVLASPLLRNGVRDAGVARLLPEPSEDNQSLTELIENTQTEIPKVASEVATRFSDEPILEELITGSDRTVAAFANLKQQAGVTGQVAAIGGDQLDQAERALFAVFLAFFELTITFASLAESPKSVCEMLLHIVKKTAEVRQWAQIQRQKSQSSSGEKRSYSDIGKEILDKCVILLSTDYKYTMSDLGIDEVLRSLLVTVQEATEEPEDMLGMLIRERGGSKWAAIHTSMNTIRQVKKLRELKQIRKAEAIEEHQPEDIRQFQAVHSLIMELLESQVGAAALVKEVRNRRTKVISRIVGLSIFSACLTSDSQGQSLGVVSGAFVDSFSTAGAKKHYTEGVEGVDPGVCSVLRTKFFSIFRHFLACLTLEAIQGVDCTSSTSFQSYMKIMDALNFPLDWKDMREVPLNHLRDFYQLLLQWAKGLNIHQNPPMKFDLQQAVIDLKVFEEAEYDTKEGIEAFSLHPKNRLAGEEAETVKGQAKRVLELRKGNSDSQQLPIVDITAAPATSQIEGYEMITGNVNEIGEELCLFVKREDPAEGGKYLKSIKVTGWNPVTFQFSYEPYETFLVADTNEEDRKGRDIRKGILQHASWLLLKVLTNTHAGRNEDKQSFSRQKNRRALQELFLELFFGQLRWLNLPAKEGDSLALRKLLSGCNWREGGPIAELRRNPVIEWMETIREDSVEYSELTPPPNPADLKPSVLDVAVNYLSEFDPTLKGAVATEKAAKQAPEEYCNSKKEADFFCFLKHVVSHADTTLSQFWAKHVKASLVYQNLPSDYYDALRNGKEIDIPAILNVLSAMFRNSEPQMFLSYLSLFLSAESSGVVPSHLVPAETPREFLNEENELDFFTTIRAICEHEEQFPTCHQEIKPIWDMCSSVPASCAVFNKAKLSGVGSEFQASLLLLIYECCSSQTMLGALSTPTSLLELLKHMFMGTLQASTISFRVMSEVLLSQHSPDSFAPYWDSFPKGKLRVEVGREASSDFVSALFVLVGIRALSHTRSLKYAYLTAEKVNRLAIEALSLLIKISKSERWRNHIITTGLKIIEVAVSGAARPSGRELLFGFFSYLECCAYNSKQSIWEWSKVKLADLGLMDGTLVQYSESSETVEIYSEDSNKFLSEKKESVLNSLFDLSLPLFNSLPTATVSALFDAFHKLLTVIVSTGLPNPDKSPEGEFVTSAVQQTTFSYIIRILTAILESKHSIPSEALPGLAATLILEMGSGGKIISERLKLSLKETLFAKHRTFVRQSVAEIADEISGEAGAGIGDVGSGEQRFLVEALKSAGLPNTAIKEAIDSGFSSAEDVLRSYASRRRASKRAKYQPENAIVLYKLTKSSVKMPVFVGKFSSASYWESESGSLMLATKDQISEPISILKTLESELSQHLETPPEEVTVIALVDLLSFDQSPCEGGLIMGDLRIKAPKNTSTFFRIFISHSGQVQVFLESTSQLLLEAQTKSSFAKVSTVQYGLFLESQGKVRLREFSIYDGHYTLPCPPIPENIPDEVTEGRLVDFEFKSPSSTEVALSAIIGVPPDISAEIAATKPDLKHALSSAIESKLDLVDFENDYGRFVQNCIVLKKGSKVPEGYSLVKIEDCGKEVGDCSAYNGPILAVQKVTGKKKDMIASLEWKSDTVVTVKCSQLQDLPIVSVLILRVPEPKQLVLPYKYTLVMEGKKAINIANKGEVCHFLAYSCTPSIRKLAFDDLLSMSKKGSEDGMVDKFADETTAVKLSSEELSKEVARFSNFSSLQLQLFYSKIEKTECSDAAFQLILKLLHQQAEPLIDSNQFAKLLEYSGSHYKELAPIMSSLLSKASLSQSVAHSLLLDFLTQLCYVCISSQLAQSQKKTLVFESTHPYDNNLDIKETISIPGAKKLSFVFSQECKSENNYDYLQFASDSEFSAVVAKQTGSSWPNFEVEADTVYMHFHSDGSNNDWGYKFEVETDVEGMSSDEGVKRALWCLEFVFSEAKFASFVPLFIGKEVVSALALCAHKVSDPSLSLRSITLLKRVLLASAEQSPNSMAVISLISQETVVMFAEETMRPKRSVFLRSLLSFLTELKEKFEFEVGAEWFNTFYENYCFLKGFVHKDEYFQYLLLSQFLAAKGKKPEIPLESAHPYPAIFATQELYVRGASRINVVLSSESEARLVDGILFSKDPAGLQPILPSEVSSSDTTSSELLWNSVEKGPDIAISNAGVTVTRTNSNGWGSAITNRVFREGRVSASFQINNDGGSAYLYIGVIQEQNPYPLSDCTYKDWGKRIWTYKVTGEAHKQGFSAEKLQALGTNDVLTVVLDFPTQLVTFLRNSQQVYQFNDLNVPVTFIACFGGSNQVITIQKMELLNKDPMKLSEYKTTIPGDRCFFHFPVHIGYFDFLFATWKPVTHPLLSFFNNNRGFAREQGDITPLTVFSNGVIRAERNLFEIRVIALGPGTVLTFGIGVTGQNEFPVTYSTNGSLKKPGGSGTLESFRAGDSIAFQLVLSKCEFNIFKNGVKQGATIRVVLGSAKEYRWCVTLNGQAKVEIADLSPLIETVDLMGKAVPTGRGAFNKYGYRLTATPVYVGTNKRFIFDTLGELQEEWRAHYDSQKNLFSDEVCQQLVEFMDEKTRAEDYAYDPTSYEEKEVNPEPEGLIPYSLLGKLKVGEIQTIFRMVKDVNRRAIEMLPLISLDLPEGAQALSEIQNTFLLLRKFLFLYKKQTILRDVLSKTNVEDSPTIEFNKVQATRLREKRAVDSLGVTSVFGQFYQQSKQCPNRSFRHADFMFQMKLVGEEADQAVSYTDLLETMCDELQSSYLPLLVQSPNGVHSLGYYRETWLPNPGAESQGDFELFRFLGKFIGMAIRTKTCLGLRLSPAFWKRLIFEPVDCADVKTFDECTYQTLDILRHLADKGISCETFGLAFDNQTFTTIDSALRLIELRPGGKSIPIDPTTAPEYADLLEKQRLSEAAFAYTAIRQGISAVLPLHHLYLFTGRQVDALVCGPPDFKVDLLKDNTAYLGGYSGAAEVIQHFWETMTDLSAKDRSLFLQFAWGRARLPASFQQFRIKKKEVEGDPNEEMPTAHARSFTLELPLYTTKKALCEKLLFAIRNSKAEDVEKIEEDATEEKPPAQE